MSTAFSARPAPRRDALFELAQALSGACLILFMWGHMLLLSSAIFGAGAFDAVAAFLEDAGLVQAVGPVICVFFLIHFLTAARKIPFSAEGWTSAAALVRLKERDTLLWGVQVLTGLCLLVMGSIHLWQSLNELPISAGRSGLRLALGGGPVFYALLLPLAELHLWIGLYRLGVKWGCITAENRAKAGRILLCLFAAFWIIGAITSRSLLAAAGDPGAAVGL